MKNRPMASPRWLLTGIIVVVALVATYPTYAAPSASLPRQPTVGANGEQYAGVLILRDTSIQLARNHYAPPYGDQAYERYGFYISPIQPVLSPTTQFVVSYDATIPNQSKLHLDVRGSYDGTRWTAWETRVASGDTVAFRRTVQHVQYRARLLGSATTGPTLHTVDIQARPGTATYQAFQQPEEAIVAPTYKVFATREGLVGGRTANGYIIEPDAWFVSLPSWRSLNTYGSYDYQVRITHGDRSVVAPVWDVGPWNAHDDYWNVHRERYQDLRRGWPEDHAAYFDGYNGGYAEKGYVHSPTAIDIGDGAWWALGLPDGRFEVEVTFLWLEGDTDEVASPPAPDPNAKEIVVSETRHNGQSFQSQAAVCWYHTRHGCGEDLHALWTLTTTDPTQSENRAFWQPQLAVDDMYDVYVHVPVCSTDYPVTQAARYLVQHRDGTQEIVVNQAVQTGWVHLGQFPFAAGNEGFVHLQDIAGDAMHTIWFDNVKWVRAGAAEE